MRGWSLSNLALQKTLYIANMIYLGRNGSSLIPEGFEAWDYGPVLPGLYGQCAMFGAKPVKDVFYFTTELPSAEQGFLKGVVDYLAPMTPGQLVGITHWPKGAWAKVYKPGARHTPIPNSLIADEYRDRQAR